MEENWNCSGVGQGGWRTFFKYPPRWGMDHFLEPHVNVMIYSGRVAITASMKDRDPPLHKLE